MLAPTLRYPGKQESLQPHLSAHGLPIDFPKSSGELSVTGLTLSRVPLWLLCALDDFLQQVKPSYV